MRLSADMTSLEVSIVLPTCNRSHLIAGAVERAFSQGPVMRELIVVVDGPDPDTVAVLEQIDDGRLVVIERDKRGGVAAARSSGIQRASSEYIAMMDDDDEWSPDKLSTQLEACADLIGAPFLSAHAATRTFPSGRQRVVPQRVPAPNETIGEFMFCRHRLGQPKGHVMSCTLLAHRDVFELVPFPTDLPNQEDWDWALRVEAAGIPWRFVDKSLMQWNLRSDEQPFTEGRGSWRWQDSLQWAQERRNLLGPRAFSGYLLSTAIDFAAAQRSWRGVLSLVRASFAGRPSLAELTHVPAVALGEQRRERLAQFVQRRRRPVIT